MAYKKQLRPRPLSPDPIHTQLALTHTDTANECKYDHDEDGVSGFYKSMGCTQIFCTYIGHRRIWGADWTLSGNNDDEFMCTFCPAAAIYKGCTAKVHVFIAHINYTHFISADCSHDDRLEMGLRAPSLYCADPLVHGLVNGLVPGKGSILYFQ